MARIIAKRRADVWDPGNHLTAFYEVEWECEYCYRGYVDCPECGGKGCECCEDGKIECPECEGEYRFYTIE